MNEDQLKELEDAAMELRAVGCFTLAHTVDDARLLLTPKHEESFGGQASLPGVA